MQVYWLAEYHIYMYVFLFVCLFVCLFFFKNNKYQTNIKAVAMLKFQYLFFEFVWDVGEKRAPNFLPCIWIYLAVISIGNAKLYF